MKKSVTVLLISAILSLFITAGSAVSDFARWNNSVNIDGINTHFNLPLYMVKDRIYVPLREFCEKTGFIISWDGAKNEASVVTGKQGVVLGEETEHKNEGVIPDKETAITVGKAILERYVEKTYYVGEDGISTYYWDAYYLEDSDSWRVVRTSKLNTENAIQSGIGYCPSIILSRSDGKVTYISTRLTHKSSFDEFSVQN